MQVAKVIGNIWATRKDDKLSGLKLLLVKQSMYWMRRRIKPRLLLPIRSAQVSERP